MATLHVKPLRYEQKNYITVTVNIDGKTFPFSYDIPDAPGEVSIPNRNRAWVEEHIRQSLKGRFGRLIPQEA